MKNLILISALVLSVISTVFSQTPDDFIDPENINVELMDSLMFVVVNKLRESKGLNTIEFDSVCYESAKYQNNYFLKNGTKSHNHIKSDGDTLFLETPIFVIYIILRLMYKIKNKSIYFNIYSIFYD